jgi:membrane-associated phospholipid phosphatase
MNAFDTQVIDYLSHITFQSQLVPHIILAVANHYLFKGLVLIALLWWVWFKPGGQTQRNHELVIAAIVSGLLALILGRLMAHYLPFRMRPMYNPAFEALFPSTAAVKEPLLRTWSSFPSDHAMLWCAVATGIFVASWRVGIYALLHAAILICLPRVFLGLHYTSDVLVGAALGIGMACVMSLPYVRTRVAAPVLTIAQRYPGAFYAMAFILSFELAMQFDELRSLAQGLTKAL